ncbi:hypothetical protein CLV78_11545 [Aliiruegeria haliotis]|uniref:Uncharacterized protein n=1 Tax=Aliiruegeria haliotis TaxID=1280846 RepID=A0A2T0RFW6_9RHOB|nr:hypothetical protein CLV78_11545 [Aliiruegeria haliotis]
MWRALETIVLTISLFVSATVASDEGDTARLGGLWLKEEQR